MGRRGDAETRGRGDGETRRKRDGETRGDGRRAKGQCAIFTETIHVNINASKEGWLAPAQSAYSQR